MPASRVERAKALRAKRSQQQSGSISTQQDDDVGEAIEIHPTQTLLCIFLLMCMGASAVTSYVMTHNPTCFTFSSSSSSSSSLFRSGTTEPDWSTQPPLPQNINLDNLPPECTSEQLTRLAEQLPAQYCTKGSPWTQQCSFCRATTQGCHDPRWLRTYLSQQNDSVHIIQVGKPDQLDELLGLLPASSSSRTSSSDATALNYPQHTCWSSLEDVDGNHNAAKPPPHVWILEDPKYDEVVRAVAPYSMVVQVDRVVPVQFAFDDSDVVSLATWANANAKLHGPIHVLRGLDYPILVGAKPILPRVQYLEFFYHWSGSWKEPYQLSTLLSKHLTPLGFVCYWYGTEGNLWRITPGCWQEHYRHKLWAPIACVNYNAAQPLLDRMEAVFAETLTKTQVFGG